MKYITCIIITALILCVLWASEKVSMSVEYWVKPMIGMERGER